MSPAVTVCHWFRPDNKGGGEAADGCSVAAVVWIEGRPSRGQSEANKGGRRRSGGRAGSQLLEFYSHLTHTYTHTHAHARARSLGQDGSRETDETGWGQKGEGGDKPGLRSYWETLAGLWKGQEMMRPLLAFPVAMNCISAAAPLSQSPLHRHPDRFITACLAKCTNVQAEICCRCF